MTRRLHRPTTGRTGRVAALAATALLLASLQACGGSDVQAQANPETSPAAAAAEPEPTGAPTVERNAFPAYVKHTWGTAVIEEEPKRVVSLGLRDHEMLLALGVTPIAVRNPFGSTHPVAGWPWMPDSVEEGSYQYLKAGLQDPKNGKIAAPVDGPIDAGGAPMAATTPYLHQVFDWELIKSLKPDLIVGSFSGLTQEDYLKLIEIAPTITDVSAEKKYYYASWQEQMLALGKATGRPAAAQKLIDDTESLFDTLRSEHPEFKDATVAVVAPAGDGKVRVINPFAPMARFFTALRMRFPAVVDSLMNAPGSKATYGVEMDSGSLPLLSNIDALVWVVGADGSEQYDKIRNSGYYQSMRVVQRGGAITLDQGLSEAVYSSSPYSIPWALEKLKPSLLKALEPKAAREAAAEVAAEKAAQRAEDAGEFTFHFGDEETAAPTTEEEEEEIYPPVTEHGATPSPSTASPGATPAP